MKFYICILVLAASHAFGADKKAPTAPPAEELLSYTINWPTGLSLGEAKLKTLRQKSEAGDKWES